MSSALEIYHDSLSEIMAADWQVGDTYELIGQMCIFDMTRPWITSSRNPGYQFCASEALMTIDGSNRDDYNEHIKATYAPWAEGGFYRGAYGPRFVDQLPWVLSELIRDPLSRRAVITIWHARPAPAKNVPCLVSLQFLIRENRLDLIANMRSNDAWLGRPCDWMVFSMLAGWVACEYNYRSGKNIGLGNCTNFIGSAHIYNKDIESAKTHIIYDDTEIIIDPFDTPFIDLAVYRDYLVKLSKTKTKAEALGFILANSLAKMQEDLMPF